jgi:ribosomal protein L18
VVGRVVRPADGHIVASASTLEDRTRIARRKVGDEENNSNSSNSTDDEKKSTREAEEGRERLASTSDKSACKHIGKLLAERLKKIQLDAINFEGLQSSASKKNEKYSGRRASFQPKRKRFGGKLSALLESLKENGVEIH